MTVIRNPAPSNIRRGAIVTGTDTDVGKTVVAAILCRAILARRPQARLVYRKLVQTGFPEDDDTKLVVAIASLDWSQWLPPLATFRLPAAPCEAAAAARRRIPTDLVTGKGALATGSINLLEGAGGLLVPLSRDRLLADTFKAIGLPLIVVTRPELGTVNHTLLTLAEAKHRGLPVEAIVFSGQPRDRVCKMIERFGKPPITLIIRRLDRLTPQGILEAGKELAGKRRFGRLLKTIAGTES